MAARYQIGFTLRALMLAFVCVFFSGCQSFDFGASQTSETAVVENKADVIGQYQMQLILKRGKPLVEKVDITGPITVQDALEASGAVNKLRTMKITLSRIIKEKGTLLKLPVEYQMRSKSVRPEQNYRLLPGDTLTVSPSDPKDLNKILEILGGGLI